MSIISTTQSSVELDTGKMDVVSAEIDVESLTVYDCKSSIGMVIHERTVTCSLRYLAIVCRLFVLVSEIHR